MPLPTIHDVAARAEVSTATVSRVLSNPEKVSEATRRRVLKAVNQLGYSPNAAAKSLRTLTTRKLLVTVPDIANPFFSLIIQGIEEAALREGYAVVLGDTHHDAEREERYGEMLLRREADGLIFLGHSMSKSVSALMKKNQLAPIVNGCEYSPSLGVPSAHVDNEAAAYEAMSHLYGLGHRQIGVITGPLASPLSRDRLRGGGGFHHGDGLAAAQLLLQIFRGDFIERTRRDLGPGDAQFPGLDKDVLAFDSKFLRDVVNTNGHKYFVPTGYSAKSSRA